MKYIKLYILGLVVCLANSLPLQGMLTSKYTALKRAAARKVAVTRAAQKRTLYTPEKLKGLYTPLTTKAQKVAPLHGAIEFETGAVQRRYEAESQAFGPQLVKEIFFQQGPQFRPTVNKSKAAYALSPEILGLVIGALETGRLQEAKVREYIIDQWQNEYRKITDEKKPFSRGKIEKLLTLIENEYNNNKDSCRNILLGFLYAKALPDNDHDMIHYLAGLNEFINVFVDQSSSTAQSVKTYVTEKKGTTPSEPTFFEKLQSGIQAVKNYMSGSSSTVFEQKDYDALKAKLQEKSTKKVEKVLKEKFELTVSAMLKEKTSASLYPPKVVQSSYGYKGKPLASDCVETAIHGLLNIILYNPQLRSFDLSLLPSTLTLNENFKQFYSTYNVNKINTQEYGQAFMDLVSGVDGVVYKRGDYELAANETEKNLLTLMNYFFGINAQTLNELGAMLSDERRTITFTGPTQGKKSMEITMNIKNNQTNKTQRAIFCFQFGHGWIEVPDMDILEGKSLFDPVELAENYIVNPEVQTLLKIEPIALTLLVRTNQLLEKPSKSFYYALPVKEDYEKKSVIRQIKNILGIDNIDTEAFDYAFHLYQQLPSDEQEDVFSDMLTMGMKEEIWRSHAKFKKFVVDNYDKALKKIVSKASSAEEYINFVKELYKEFPDELSKYKFMIYALGETINTKILDTHLIKILYEQIVNNQYKKNFLADLLLMFVNYPELAKKINIVAIAEKCINDGVDIKENAISTSSTAHATYSTAPLVSAIRMGNVPLVELLVDSGISINAPLKYKKSGPLVMNATPLWITELEKNSLEQDNKMTEFLLAKGANPNSTLKFGPISSHLIIQAISSLNGDKVNLLLKYGADVNVRNSSEETSLDVFNENENKFPASYQKEIRDALLSAGAKTSAELLKGNIEESVTEDKQKQLNIE